MEEEDSNHEDFDEFEFIERDEVDRFMEIMQRILLTSGGPKGYQRNTIFIIELGVL